MSWNYSEAVDRLGSGPVADRVAIHHDGEDISFGELRRRCRGIAAWLQEQGLGPRVHVGHYMRNSNAYLETFLGGGLAGHAHVNVNYRYQDSELSGLCNTLDIQVLVYDAEFADCVARIRPQLVKTTVFIEVLRGEKRNEFAAGLQELYGHPDDKLVKDTAPENQILIATGGTTGLPKGTQWRQTDVWHKMSLWATGAMEQAGLPGPPDTLDDFLAALYAVPPIAPVFPMCPLMHGTGLLAAISALAQGTTVVTTANPHLDPDECLDIVARYKVGRIVIVGDAFAMPLLDTAESRGDGALDSLNSVVSSGAILSEESRRRFLAINPDMIVFDTFGSSEAIGIGIATSESGVFIPLRGTRVFDDEMQEVQPGDGRIGMAYSGGYSPIGYYNEPEKSAETFVTIDGKPYVRTGDRCRVREDGKLELLGRDSTVVNSGGEKIYTVEVEKELMGFPGIADAVVIGLPHPRFGKAVAAVVEGPGISDESIDVDAIQSFLRDRLAGYKVPRHIYVTGVAMRYANGKPDYAAIQVFAEERRAQEESAAGTG
ncbi:MAG: AMP-binding protein [Halioglobus sp.]